MCIEIRNFRKADLEGFVALYNASEATDPDFRELTVREIRRYILEHSSHDPEGHFVAIEGDQIVASGNGTFASEHLEITGPVGHFRLYILPDYLGKDVEKKVFAKIVDHLKGRGVELIRTRVDTRHESKVNLLERLGFSRSGYQNHGMELDPRDVGEPTLREGYRIRVARMPEEIEMMVGVFNEAFSTRERYPPMSVERFKRSWVIENEENHSGFFLAERETDERVVGMVLSGINRKFNEEHGVKRGGSYALAVVPSERRKGLGTALTLKSIRWIGNKGTDVAYVSVNVANQDALKIYRALGYRTIQVYQGYRLRIA